MHQHPAGTLVISRDKSKEPHDAVGLREMLQVEAELKDESDKAVLKTSFSFSSMRNLNMTFIIINMKSFTLKFFYCSSVSPLLSGFLFGFNFSSFELFVFL